MSNRRWGVEENRGRRSEDGGMRTRTAARVLVVKEEKSGAGEMAGVMAGVVTDVVAVAVADVVA